MNPFNWRENRGKGEGAKIAAQLQDERNKRESMTKWVEKKRAAGHEPCHLSLEGSSQLVPITGRENLGWMDEKTYRMRNKAALSPKSDGATAKS